MNETSVCERCGAPRPSSSPACPSCGLSDVGGSVEVVGWQSATLPPRRWKALAAVLVVVGILAIGLRIPGIVTSASEHAAARAAASAAAVHWPTVREARNALIAAGHDLVADRKDPAKPRWTGFDPSISRIEIVGADDDPAILTLKIVIKTDGLSDTKDFLGVLPGPIHTTAAITFGDAIQASTVHPDQHITRSATVPHGRVDVDMVDGVCIVVLRPDPGTT